MSVADGSQIVPFMLELIRMFDDDQQARLQKILAGTFGRSLRARPPGYAGYEPRRHTVPMRHAVYSANVLTLNVAAAPDGQLHASALFGSAERVVETWRSYALLWKSQLDTAAWDGLISSLQVDHLAEGYADLSISYNTVRLTKPIEHFRAVTWLKPTGIGSDLSAEHSGIGADADSVDTGIGADKTAWQAIFLCAPELDLLMHSLQPLLRISPHSFRQLLIQPDGQVQTALHLALSALITDAKLDVPDRSHRVLLSWLLRTTDTPTLTATAPAGAGKTTASLNTLEQVQLWTVKQSNMLLTEARMEPTSEGGAPDPTGRFFRCPPTVCHQL